MSCDHLCIRKDLLCTPVYPSCDCYTTIMWPSCDHYLTHTRHCPRGYPRCVTSECWTWRETSWSTWPQRSVRYTALHCGHSFFSCSLWSHGYIHSSKLVRSSITVLLMRARTHTHTHTHTHACTHTHARTTTHMHATHTLVFIQATCVS